MGQPFYATRSLDRSSEGAGAPVPPAKQHEWLPASPGLSPGKRDEQRSYPTTRTSLPPGAAPATPRRDAAVSPAEPTILTPPRRAASASAPMQSSVLAKVPETPPPSQMRRSFFGIKSSKGPSPGPPPPASESKPPQVARPSTSASAKSHARRVSNGDVEADRASSSSSRTAANSGGAKNRLSMSVGRSAAQQRPARASPPERDEWVMLAEPELRGIPGYMPPGTPTHLATAPPAAFASPSFFPQTPPTSENEHGKGSRRVGDAREWEWQQQQGHGQRQASGGRVSYEDAARAVVGSLPPAAYASQLAYPITPPPAQGRVHQPNAFSADHVRSNVPPPPAMSYGRPQSQNSSSQNRSRTVSGSPEKRLPPRRDSLQFSPSISQRSSIQQAPAAGLGSPSRRDPLPARRESLQAFQPTATCELVPELSRLFLSNTVVLPDPAAQVLIPSTLTPGASAVPVVPAPLQALPRSTSSGYSPLAAFLGTSSDSSHSPSPPTQNKQTFRADPPPLYDTQRYPEPAAAFGNRAVEYSSRSMPSGFSEPNVCDAVRGNFQPVETVRAAPTSPVAPPLPAKQTESRSNHSSVQATRPHTTSSVDHPPPTSSSSSMPNPRSVSSSVAAEPTSTPTPRTASAHPSGALQSRPVDAAIAQRHSVDSSASDSGRQTPTGERRSVLAAATSPPPSPRSALTPLSPTAAAKRESVVRKHIEKLERERAVVAVAESDQVSRQSTPVGPPVEPTPAGPVIERVLESEPLLPVEPPTAMTALRTTEREVALPIPLDGGVHDAGRAMPESSPTEPVVNARIPAALDPSPLAPVVEPVSVQVVGKPTVDAVVQAPAPVVEDPRPRFEFALIAFPTTVLVSLLHHVSYRDFRALRLVTKALKRSLDHECKELVLQRYLGPMGYRSLPSRFREPSVSNDPRSSVAVTLAATTPESIELAFADLDAFRTGLKYTVRDFARFAKDHAKAPLPLQTLVLIRSATRAYNRVVLRIRAQHAANLAKNPRKPLYYFYKLASSTPVYKNGRAPTLRVWVPTRTGWMDDSEVVEVEREIWRGGVWTHTRRGDVVHNVAVGDFGNEGKLVSDGKFLRDLAFTYDLIGHLPPFLDMLTFAPAFYHNVIASSTSNPVFFLGLSAFASQVRERLQLCDETVNISSPQGSYAVKRFVYRSVVKIKPGLILGSIGGAGGSGPGGVEVVDPDWAGVLILETDGTSENAAALLARCASKDPTPFRIVREKSRPGSLWLRPVLQNERIN